MALTFTAIAQSAKKTQKIKIFTASMADIEKALLLKVHLSSEEVTKLLPDNYKRFSPLFNLKEAYKLPPRKPRYRS